MSYPISNTEALNLGDVFRIQKPIKTVIGNTAWKAMPTTGFLETVPVPPAGWLNVFLGAIIITDFTAGAYTNFSTADGAGYIGIETNTNLGYGSSYIYNDAASVSPFTSYSDLFAAAKNVTFLWPYSRTPSFDFGLAAQVQPYSDYAGNLGLSVGNPAGNYTAGHANNTVTVWTRYGLLVVS